MARYQWYAGGNNSLSLTLSGATVRRCHHPGDCGDDIKAEIASNGPLRLQLEAMNAADLAAELSEYTDWDCSDVNTNRERILWIACGDIAENPAAHKIGDF